MVSKVTINTELYVYKSGQYEDDILFIGLFLKLSQSFSG